VPLLAPLAGVTIAWDEFWTLPALAAAVGLTGVLMRVHGRWLRIADVAEAAGALGLLAVFVPLLTCMLARTGGAARRSAADRLGCGTRLRLAAHRVATRGSRDAFRSCSAMPMRR
jgi:hypothetical protein